MYSTKSGCHTLCRNRPVIDRSRCKSVWKMQKGERWLCVSTMKEMPQAKFQQYRVSKCAKRTRELLKRFQKCTFNVLNIVRKVKDPSRILQRVSIVTSVQKTTKSILMNLHFDQSVTAPVQTRPSFPSEAPAEHLTLGNCWQSSEKLKTKNLLKEEEQQKRLGEKGAKRPRKSIEKLNN